MKILFMGTPDFSVPCLQALIDSPHEVSAVVCQPDKPKGRSQIMTFPPVKQKALENGIPVLQPATLKNGKGVALLREIEPDIVVVVAYGKILPPDFLQYPKYGCVNIHGSLLPRYRGASPIQWAILNGDEETGVTSMLMDEGVDTGDILLVKKTPIGENETAGELFDRLSALGAQLLTETLEKIQNGSITPTAQPHENATCVGMLSREQSPVDWNKAAKDVHNQIRGLYPWPGATCVLEGKTVKLHASVLPGQTADGANGEVICSDGSLVIRCGDGQCLAVTELQLEGKKRMTASDFLNGRKIPVGTVLH